MTNEEFQNLVLKNLGELKSDVSGLKFDFSGLKSDVSGLKSDVSILKSDVSGLKSDVSTLKSDVSGLKSDVATLKSDVSGLKSDVSTLNQGLESLESKVVAGFTDVVTIITATQKEVQSIRHDLRIIEAVTAKNWNAIIDLQKAE